VSPDDDDREGFFNGTLTWGPNIIGGVVDESIIDSYLVLLVDDCGSYLTTVAEVTKVGVATGSCCNPEVYSLPLIMELPAGYHHFQIHVVSGPKTTRPFYVEGGSSSGPIIDKTLIKAVAAGSSREAGLQDLRYAILKVSVLALSCIATL